VGENDPGALADATEVLAYLGEDIGAMIGLVDRALALNPSYPIQSALTACFTRPCDRWLV
jgi:hypothetical protein